jgi:hypothetical protein
MVRDVGIAKQREVLAQAPSLFNRWDFDGRVLRQPSFGRVRGWRFRHWLHHLRHG